jgi:hypothetical protein
MNGKHVVWSLAVGAALVVGCDRTEDPAPPSTPPAAPVPPAPDVTPKSGAAGATDSSGAPGATAGTTSSPTAGDLAGDADTSTTTTPDPKSAQADAAAARIKEAQQHLEATNQHLADKKPELARQSLQKAEAIQGDLPAALREQIKTMRSTVDNAVKSEDLPALTDDDDENK